MSTTTKNYADLIRRKLDADPALAAAVERLTRRTPVQLRPSSRAGKMGSPVSGASKVGRKRAEPDTSTYQGRFAARLGELVEARGLTPVTFAEKVGVHKSMAYHWLSGRGVPPLNDWPTIAKVLRVTSAELLPQK